MALPEAPNSRAEQYLAKIAGQDGSIPEAPNSRVEQYLEYIAENGTVSKEEVAEQVSEWLEENIHEDPTVVIDSSLSVSGAAADAKKAGDRLSTIESTVQGLQNALAENSPVDIQYDVVTGKSINSETGEEADSSVYCCTDYIDVRKYGKIACKRIGVTNTNNYIGMAFYNANKEHMFGYVCEWSNASLGYVGTEYYSFPKEIAYVRCTMLADTASHGDFPIRGYMRLCSDEDIEIEPYAPMINDGYLQIYTGVIGANQYFCTSDYIECGGWDYLSYSRRITTTYANRRYGISFYDASKNALAIGSGMIVGTENAVTKGYMTIPTNAKYVRMSYPVQDQIVSNSYPDCYIKLHKVNTISQRLGRSDGLIEPISGLYFRKPSNKGVENAIKRMHQITKVKWTPVSNCPRMLYSTDGTEVVRTNFCAGVEYTGIPYSPSYNRTNNVGIERSIYNFVSVVSNPKTRMFDNTISSYPNYSYYGDVCSAFVSMAMDLKCAPLTKDMPDFIWFDKIAPASAYSVNTLELGDILLKPDDHASCISGILCDDNGVVKMIEISEETLNGYIQAGKAISKWYSPTQLMTRFAEFDLYRYRYINDVEYSESDFAQVFPEGASYRNLSKYIYPVFGDKCIASASGANLDLAVSDSAYTDGVRTVKIYKNGQLISTETIDNSGDPIQVSRSIGRYYACALDNDSAVMDTTSWEILGGTFSGSISGNVASISYNTDSTVYAVTYRITGDTDDKYIPIKPVTGEGTLQVGVPDNATLEEVVIGNRNGLTHISI